MPLAKVPWHPRALMSVSSTSPGSFPISQTSSWARIFTNFCLGYFLPETAPKYKEVYWPSYLLVRSSFVPVPSDMLICFFFPPLPSKLCLQWLRTNSSCCSGNCFAKCKVIGWIWLDFCYKLYHCTSQTLVITTHIATPMSFLISNNGSTITVNVN